LNFTQYHTIFSSYNRWWALHCIRNSVDYLNLLSTCFVCMPQNQRKPCKKGNANSNWKSAEIINRNQLKKCIIQYYWTSICILGIYCKCRVLQRQKVEALNCVGEGGHFNWGYVFRKLVQMPNLPNIIEIALSYF
jgi:hypothetical protein